MRRALGVAAVAFCLALALHFRAHLFRIRSARSLVGPRIERTAVPVPVADDDARLRTFVVRLRMLAERGLRRAADGGTDGLRIIMMCEVPSNAILADQFLQHFDGMSIGSNDLTQLTLGLDRDSGLALLANDFDERDPAVKAMISRAITACRATGKYVGICGQGPSDHPDFADWLAQEGIVSISLNPDSVIDTWQRLAKR